MLNQILSALNDYAFAFNQDEDEYYYISDNIKELTGYDRKEFENNSCLWFSLIDVRDKERVEEMYNKPLEEDRSISITYRIITLQGLLKWVNDKRCLYIEEHGKRIILSLIKDLQPEEEIHSVKETLGNYGILFDNNPNPMWIYESSSLRFLKVNDAAIKTYGYSEAEFLTMTIMDIRPNDDRAALGSFLSDRVTGFNFTGYSNSGIWRHLSKSGELIHAELYGDTIQYKHCDCRLTVATNVTERLYYQEEAQIREQFLNSLIDSQTNFLIRIDMLGNYTFVNKQFLKTLGFNKTDIIGKHFNTTTIPEDSYLCEEAFYDCVNNPGKVVHLVHKKPDAQGGLHHTEWELIAVTNESREVVGIQGIGQDITEKVNSQKEITWTKKSLEAIINNTEDLIWSLDRDLQYLYMNQAYKNTIRRQTGLEPQTGESSLHAKYEKDFLKKWAVYYNRAFSGESYVVENKWVDKLTGSAIFFETGFNPIYNADGKITGIGCFSRNITERINANKSIMDQNERLQHIASLSSHELRRPVATMLGLLNVVDRENFSNPDNKDILDHLLVVGNEIDDVIRLIVNKTFICE